jgi:hypothetical protein
MYLTVLMLMKNIEPHFLVKDFLGEETKKQRPKG